jgi:DNA helicase-2/ATP-dependent DNA helicase PcrA
MNLNEQQKQAVQHLEGPLLILAGAGSGKTRVLTERIVHLVESNACKPYEILAVTFTNKAANEMRMRVEKGIGIKSREIWISTFHSACVKILRRHGENIGLSPQFVIYDDSDQLGIVKRILRELNISEKLVSPRGALEKISRSKDSNIESKDYPDGDFYGSKIALVYRAYETELKKNGAVDFGDLIMLTVKLFKTVPAALDYYGKKFRYIMVDEYQDTNHSQYELVKLLAAGHKNIGVVGDPDQSIYAWRGADISNILEFERDFEGARVIKLEQNYRSTKNILAASDAVIANNTNRKPKQLWSEGEYGDKIHVVETSDEREEAKHAVQEIKKLEGEGIKLNDIAIFYRTNAQSRPFEDELRRQGIPYVIFGGMKFYNRAEIKDCIAYLRLVANPSDNISLRRIINTPHRLIGKTTVAKLDEYSAKSGLSIYEFIRARVHESDFNSKMKQKLFLFTELIKQLHSLASVPLSELVTEVISRTKYVEALANEKTDEAVERISNVDELISAVSEACKLSPEMTLSDFLDQVALVSDIDKYDESRTALPLMTLHLAKGLEFSNVFIVGLEEGMLPHIRAVDKPDELEEERRLFYVGMTRAKKFVCLCHANTRLVRGNYTYNVSSRFLDEIPDRFVFKTSKVVKRESVYFKKRADNFADDFSQVAPDVGHFFSHEEDNAAFRVGMRVRHPSFGEGIIRKTEGKANSQKLFVQFRNGDLKRLSAEYANLAIVA